MLQHATQSLPVTQPAVWLTRRTLTRSPGMMLVFRSVTLSLASMANVSIVVGLFFLIFAIMGVQLFGGRFWTCNDISVANKVGQEGSQLKG